MRSGASTAGKSFRRTPTKRVGTSDLARQSDSYALSGQEMVGAEEMTIRISLSKPDRNRTGDDIYSRARSQQSNSLHKRPLRTASQHRVPARDNQQEQDRRGHRAYLRELIRRLFAWNVQDSKS